MAQYTAHFISKHLTLLAALLLTLFFAACGGGGSSPPDPDTTPPPSTTLQPTDPANTAILGRLSGASINAFRLTAIDNSIEQTVATTLSGTTNLAQAGRFRLALANIPSQELILVRATGGLDVDTNDDGILDAQPTQNQGSVYAIAIADIWRNNLGSVNILSDIAYQQVQANLATLSATQVKARLDWAASQLVSDLNGDNRVDHNDLVRFIPTDSTQRTSLPFDYNAVFTSIDSEPSLISAVLSNENNRNEAINRIFTQPLALPELPTQTTIAISYTLPQNVTATLTTNLTITANLATATNNAQATVYSNQYASLITANAATRTVLMGLALPSLTALELNTTSTVLAAVVLYAGGLMQSNALL